MQTKPLFSVVLIAKNEAKVLPRAIESLKEFMSLGGDVNIVDTGSTDGTPELARSLGCRVKEVGPKYVHVITEEESNAINDRFIVENEMPVVSPGLSYFDFASARNDSVSMADCDWVCTMDCDEVLTKMDIGKINEIISNESLGQLEYNFVFSHDFYGNELIKFVQSKFYNRKRMNWVGIIHEMVTPLDGVTVGLDRQFLPEDIFKLEHWQNEETKRGQYLTGLAVDCFEHQEKDRNSHYFARELWWNGRPWSAAKEFKRHIAMNGWAAERAESMLFLGDIYGAMEKKEEQIAWFAKALDTDPTRREPLIKLAQTYMRRNEPIPANFYATAALELPWHGFYGSNKSFYENEPHEILYWAKGWLGDIEGGKKHLLKCLEYQRENPKYLHDTQFFFPYPANNITGWFSFKEQLFVHEAAKQMESVIELGSWKGKSTHAICKSGCPDVTAIDTWEGSEFEPEAHAEAKSGSVEAEFRNNLKDFPDLKIVKANINDVVDNYADKSVDMIFIDAGHTEAEVRNDIAKWLPKARLLICGHDYVSGWPGVIAAVDSLLGGPDGLADTVWYKWINKPLVSICIPHIGRHEKLNRLLKAIKENAGYDNYEIIVEEDKPIPNNEGCPKVLKRCVERSKGEHILFLGNDCVPEKNFLQEAVFQMYRKFPEGDGMVGLNDQYWNGDEGHVSTHFLISKKLLPHLDRNEIFDTEFFHRGVDNLLQGQCENLGKYTWAKKAKIFHDHPINNGFTEKMDEIHEMIYSDNERNRQDHELYQIKSKKLGIRKF